MGAQANLGLGPLTLTSNAGFETLRAEDKNQNNLGDYWYEPLPEGEVIVEPLQTVQQPQDGGSDGSQYFGLQVNYYLLFLTFLMIFASGRRGCWTSSLERWDRSWKMRDRFDC